VTPAETLLQELGVTDPEEIDVEAIAFFAGARIRYRHLHGCEAHIVGRDGRAVITIKDDSSYRRKRFSIAHELGHWRHHRGKTLVCRVDDYRPRDRLSPEKVADNYAADLLMPRYLFQPCARALQRLTFDGIKTLSDTFKTSMTATAIRLIDLDHVSGFIICHDANGRKWFARAPSVPRRWFPREDLDPESFAFGVQFGARPDVPSPRKIGADAWFSRADAARFNIREQTIRVRDETLTLLLLDDEQMLDE
jgi:IrrE N-terminal-like domain